MPPMDRRRGPSCGTTKGPKKRRHDRTLSSRIPNHWTTLLHCVIAVCYLSCPTTSRGGVGALSITTFNILAAVHRSMPISTITTNNDGNPLEASAALPNRRESEEREWWLPRAEGLARFVAEELTSSDAVLLQEWWFGPEFQEIFDQHTGHIFDRVAEQRPGPVPGTLREDGMAVLVKKKSQGGKLELIGSSQIRTGPQRIAQVVECRERTNEQRTVLLGNAHLSFPGGPDPIANERRQAFEAHLLARTLTRRGRQLSASDHPSNTHEGHLQIFAGDFNSNSQALASTVLESTRYYNFINCMSAHAEQNLQSIGGPVSTGVTHRTHRGEHVSVDQIFARLMNPNGSVSKTSLGRLGGPAGTHVVDCRKRLLCIEGEGILSDHMPVTATLYWPTLSPAESSLRETRDSENPFQSPWDT